MVLSKYQEMNTIELKVNENNKEFILSGSLGEMLQNRRANFYFRNYLQGRLIHADQFALPFVEKEDILLKIRNALTKYGINIRNLVLIKEVSIQIFSETRRLSETMLNELLKHDNLGDADEISFVLFQALTPVRKQFLKDVRKFCASQLFSISPSFDGIVRLLAFANIIEADDRTVVIKTKKFDPAENRGRNEYFRSIHFFNCLFERLKELDCIGDLFNENNLRFSHTTNQYYVKSHLISFKFFTIRNLLLKLAFLERDATIPDHLLKATHFTRFFEDTIISGIKTTPNLLAFDIDELTKTLEQKAEFGGTGELFALSYEQKRLKGHARMNQVKRISDDHVSAGYDISSFDNLDSFINDRFIEVKTYSNEIVFYWSKQEVAVAKDLRNKYWLYLVDGSRITSSDYVPKMIQDPYRKIFENEQWKKETEKWKIFIDD